MAIQCHWAGAGSSLAHEDCLLIVNRWLSPTTKRLSYINLHLNCVENKSKTEISSFLMISLHFPVLWGYFCPLDLHGSNTAGRRAAAHLPTTLGSIHHSGSSIPAWGRCLQPGNRQRLQTRACNRVRPTTYVSKSGVTGLTGETACWVGEGTFPASPPLLLSHLPTSLIKKTCRRKFPIAYFILTLHFFYSSFKFICSPISFSLTSFVVLLLGTYTWVIVLSPWIIDPSIIMECSSLSLVMFPCFQVWN